VLDAEPTLRRSVSEPAIPNAAKMQLVTGVFHGKVGDAAEQVLQRAVEQRWSRVGALADALERAGVVAHVVAAEQAGQLDALEDELFRFGRIVDGSPALREALGDRAAPLQAKRTLIDTLTRGKVGVSTRHLLEQAASGRGRQFTLQLEDYQKVTATRRNRLLATVRVAHELGPEQLRRLGSALEAQYNHPVHLNVIVDPEVLGGVRVTIGDEVIDSTIATRLADAERRLG
jgi:F-type H+-transporting ATPase subunit delta